MIGIIKNCCDKQPEKNAQNPPQKTNKNIGAYVFKDYPVLWVMHSLSNPVKIPLNFNGEKQTIFIPLADFIKDHFSYIEYTPEFFLLAEKQGVMVRMPAFYPHDRDYIPAQDIPIPVYDGEYYFPEDKGDDSYTILKFDPRKALAFPAQKPFFEAEIILAPDAFPEIKHRTQVVEFQLEN